jgi:hypothetical protein
MKKGAFLKKPKREAEKPQGALSSLLSKFVSKEKEKQIKKQFWKYVGFTYGGVNFVRTWMWNLSTGAITIGLPLLLASEIENFQSELSGLSQQR